MTVSCEQCPHGQHIGECDADVQRSGVTTNCMCFTALGLVRDVRALRRSDAAQQRQVAELHRTRGRRPYRLEDQGDVELSADEHATARRHIDDAERQIAADIAALDYDEDRLPWEQQ